MSYPVMALRRKVYRASQVYIVDRWCLICGQEVAHRFEAANDTTINLEWELIISVTQSKWNEDNDPRLDISLIPRWKAQNKHKLYAEVTITIDQEKKNTPAPVRYTVLKFNMARVEEKGYSELLRTCGDGMGLPIKPNLTKVIVSIQLVYIDGPLEVITVNEPKAHPEEIPQKLCKLLDSGTLSDVIFEVRGREIKAHRAILSAMSDTFAAMFQHDLIEKKSGRVVIKDCEPDVFQALIKFIYSGEKPSWRDDDEDRFALGLLVVADKYSMLDLRSLCLVHLLQNLTPQNAVSNLMTFETLGLSTGKDFVYSYLRLNKTTVLESEAWKEFLDREPRKAADILMRLVSQPDTMELNLSTLLPSTYSNPAPTDVPATGEKVKRLRQR